MKKSTLSIGFLLAMSLVMVNFTSCNDVDDPNNLGKIGTLTEIRATNVIGDTDSVATVKLIWWDWDEETYEELTKKVIAEAPFVNNGFTLHLPEVLADEFLFPFGEIVGDEDVTISDRNAMVFFTELDAGLDVFDKNGYHLGFFVFMGEDESRFCVVMWFYADRDVSLTGSDERTVHNISLRKGWNMVYLIVDLENGTELVTTRRPAGVKFKWYFETWDWDWDWDSLSTRTKSLRSAKSLFAR